MLKKIKSGRIMLSWNCTLPESKKLKFIKEQEASGLLSSLGIRESLSKIPLLRLLLF